MINHHLTAAEILSPSVITVDAGQSLKLASKYMRENDIRHIVVVDQYRLIGVLSERDVLLCSSKFGEHSYLVPDLELRKALHTPLRTMGPTISVSAIAELFLEHKIHCVPIVSDTGELLGVVTSSDLMEILAGKQNTQFKNRRGASVFFQKLAHASDDENVINLLPWSHPITS